MDVIVTRIFIYIPKHTTTLQTYIHDDDMTAKHAAGAATIKESEEIHSGTFEEIQRRIARIIARLIFRGEDKMDAHIIQQST